MHMNLFWHVNLYTHAHVYMHMNLSSTMCLCMVCSYLVCVMCSCHSAFLSFVCSSTMWLRQHGLWVTCLCSFQQSKGVVMLEFERPLDASSTSADDNTNSIPLDGPATFIMARGPSNEFGSLQDYHG